MTDPRMVEQGSDEWKALRLGHVTASKVADIMAKGRSGEAVTRKKYKMQLVAERLTEMQQDSFSSAAMEWGVEQEQFAAIEYEAAKGVFADKTGFWPCEEVKWLSVSPDRLVGEDGLVEIKCPNTTTHMQYLFAQKVPTEYYKQIQCQLWVTGRKWCDFVSYAPRLPKRNQLLIVRTERDEELITEMKAEVEKFLAEVESLIIKLGE